MPITSPDFNVPGFYAMEMSLGGRYEVFSTTDENASLTANC